MTQTIYPEDKDIKECPLPWQIKGLQQTASGYGRKLTTSKKVKYNGRWYRVYCSQYSNSGTAYILAQKKWIVVSL